MVTKLMLGTSSLYVDNNRLSPVSMLMMREMQWASLTHLLLSTFDSIKIATELETRDANTFRESASLK